MFSLIRIDRSVRRPDLPGQLLSAPHFQNVVQRERMRADRASLRFALLKISPPPGENQPQVLQNVAAHIVQRIRETDVAGCVEDGLAVMLFDADSQGAKVVARDLWRQARDARLRCEILIYPDAHDEEPPQNELREECCEDAWEQGRPEASIAGAAAMFAQATPGWKRAIDVVASACGLLALLPLFIAVAALIKLLSKGPVIFRQQRMGLGGRPFTMLKFRTMRQDAEQLQAELRKLNEQDGPAFKIKNDPRITWIGRILRKTCIDELPQLWNVFRGDMSLVGPRPLPVAEAQACERWSGRRHDVAPGLTCIWQTSRTTRNISFSEWMRMDLSYIRQRSPRRDIGLILRTLYAVLLARASH